MDGHPAAGGLDGIRVVTLPAAIDQDSAGQVQAALVSALTAGVTALVADMTATGYCNLEGVQALVRARRAAQAAGAQFRLAAVQPAVQAILDRTGTSTLLGADPATYASRDGQESAAPA